VPGKTSPARFVVALLASAAFSILAPAVEADDDLLPAVLELLKDPDRELRSLALQQVREGLKGQAVTKALVELLPTLSAEAQADLLVALGARGDASARPALTDAYDSPSAEVRVAALRAAATLGEASDVPRLAQGLAASNELERHAARSTLERIQGEGVERAIIAQLEEADGDLLLGLIELVVVREATGAVPRLIALVGGPADTTSAAAVAALGHLAGPEHVSDLARLLLAAEEPAAREVLERNIMFACRRIEDAGRQAEPLLAVMAQSREDERLVLLRPLGRIGGPGALKIIEAAVASHIAERREAGVRALCNWPDASVAPQLLQLARTADDRGQRVRAVRALMRVSVLPDDRSEAQRLALLEQSLALAERDDETRLALDRARAVRTVESLRFVLPYLRDPKFAETACATLVELAHHRHLRAAHEAEFDKALDAVISTSKNSQLVARAKRYRKGQTH